MRTLKIYAHSRDCNQVIYTDAEGKSHKKEGYLPYGIGIGGGDDVNLTIDADTGQILNWKAPLHAEVLESMDVEQQKDE